MDEHERSERDTEQNEPEYEKPTVEDLEADGPTLTAAGIAS